jgi:CRISP-associated protein Cas1
MSRQLFRLLIFCKTFSRLSMIKRTLYFGSPAYISTRHEQLLVRLPEVEKNDTLPDAFKKEVQASIPIEDIGVVVLDHQQIVISHALIAKLLANNVAFVTCNNTHHPTGLLLNLDGNTLQSQRFQAQVEASEPLKKNLWQQTIKAKIINQAAVLKLQGCEWANDVKSGDTDNHEARASAWYWQHIFKNKIAGFTRHREGVPPNNVLNYAYSLIRATVARSLVGSGLLPTLGIFHRNQYNAYCLADDIMEPYRPFADRLVVELLETESPALELTPAVKKKLLVLPALDVDFQGEKSPLMVATQRTSASLARCFLGETRRILYPEMP